MTTRMLATLVLLAAAAGPAASQQLQFDLSAGYQWLDVTGNADVFRSQAREKEGLSLDSLSLVATDQRSSRLFDRLRLEAAGLGETADSRVHLELDRAKLFSLRLAYRRAEVFSALPQIANPFAAAGITPGQHTLDRQRDLFDLQLALLPGRWLVPIVGYTRTAYAGTARTTYHLGNDEFQLASDLDETVDEYRIGVEFEAAGLRGGVIQGWRETDSSEKLALLPGAGAGNNQQPTLGRDVTATSLERRIATSASAPFTNAYVSGVLGGRVRLLGSFATTNAESESSEFDSAVGQFASFELRRFFLGVTETAQGRAESPAWRGQLRVELPLLAWLDLSAGYTASHRELDGHSFVTSEYFDTLNFSGVELGDLSTVLEARTAWERDEGVAELRLAARPVPWLRVWGAAATVDSDVTVAPAAAEVVLPGGQGGSYTRTIHRLSGGAAVEAGPAALSAEWTTDNADEAVVRTDFLDRNRLRLRGSFKPSSWLRLSAVGEQLEATNATPGIDASVDSTRWGGELEMTPTPWLSLRGGINLYQSDSRFTVRRPQDFGLEPSIYAEDGEEVDGAVALDLGRFEAQVGTTRATYEGSTPFDLDRTFLRFELGLTGTLGVLGHFEHREYREASFPVANYEADRYSLLLRWNRK
jgi:hypothetical protein